MSARGEGGACRRGDRRRRGRAGGRSRGGASQGCTPAERVYGSNVFNVLAFTTGTPGRPVNAIPPKAVANCQLRFVAGTDADAVMPALQRHLDASAASRRVKVMPPPAVNDGRFAATRTEPDHPWAQFVARLPAALCQRQAGDRAADGRLDLQRRLHGHPRACRRSGFRIPTPSCSQHAPDEHILMPRHALGHRADGGALLGHRRRTYACDCLKEFNVSLGMSILAASQLVHLAWFWR